MNEIRDRILGASAELREEEVVRTKIGDYDLLVTNGTAWVKAGEEWIHLQSLLDPVFGKE